jgi:hypothetical protein
MAIESPKPTAAAEPPPSISARRSELASASNTSAIWEPVATTRAVTTSIVIERAGRSSPILTAAIEAQLIDALTRPLHPGETHYEGGARRERDVAALLLALDDRDAYELTRRLQRDRNDDPLVAAFGRLVTERQQRLRAVLAARRRVRER